MSEFSTERAAVIRANLIGHVAEQRRPRRRAPWALALVLAGAIAGAGAAAGAFAVTGSLSTTARPTGEPTPDYPGAVTAPEGVIPGAPVVVMLGDLRSIVVTASTTVSLVDRPAGATHARVTVTPSTPGSLVWGTNADGNNPSASWNRDDLASGRDLSGRYDFPLDASVTTLYLDAHGVAGGAFEGVVSVQFITQIPTRLGVNDAGQTYGVSGSIMGDPVLVAVVGTTRGGASVDGYAFADQLNASSPDRPGLPSSPAEALAWQRETQEKYPHGWDVPVYDRDGTTQIGTFHIGG